MKYQGEIFHGLMGECPSWHKDRPTIACQEGVSGCLLGRQNAAGNVIPFSPRGELAEGGSFDPFQYVVTGSYTTGPTGGMPIRELPRAMRPGRGRRDPQLRSGPQETSLVGRCEPGAPVSLGAGYDTGCNTLGSHIDGDPVMRA